MAKKSYKRELIEWSLFIAIGLGLYLTGWHTEVIGGLQRLVLATGLVAPDTEQSISSDASYDLSLQSLDGKTISFTEFKGKTIFLNFWATWCPPCVAEMPDIQSLYEKMGGEVVFVMISLDNDPAKARKFIDRKGFDMPVYFPASRIPAVFKHQTIPTTYVLSPNGKIVLTQNGMSKYNTEDFRMFLREVSRRSEMTLKD